MWRTARYLTAILAMTIVQSGAVEMPEPRFWTICGPITCWQDKARAARDFVDDCEDTGRILVIEAGGELSCHRPRLRPSLN